MEDNDNKNKCPLCGKETHEGETFCRDCQVIAQNAYPDELLTHGEIDEILEDEGEALIEAEEIELPYEDGPSTSDEGIAEDNTTNRNNKKIYIFVAVCLVLLIAAGAYSGYNNKQRGNARETEIAYWNKCIEENSPLGYSKYLVQYPAGEFAQEAEKKIRELRDAEKNQWETLRNTSNIDALFAFLIDHPQTPYARDIRHAIDSLSWIAVANENTADSYLAYIENVRLGRYTGVYVETAQERYDYLSQLKQVEGDELKEVKTILDGFFKSLSSLDNKLLSGTVPDTIPLFYKSVNKTAKAIVDSLKTDIKTRKIKSVSYTYTSDSLDVIRDNKGIYFISVPVVEEYAYTTRRKKNDAIKYSVKMELTDKKQVRSIQKKIDK